MDFDEIAQAHFPDNLSITEAEAHGIVTGMLAMGQVLTGNDWVTPAFGDELSAELFREGAVDVLELMSKEIRKSLVDLGVVAIVPIPGDDHALSVRATAVESWINGILSGLGLAGFDKTQLQDEEIREVISDLEKLSRELGKLSEWQGATEEDENDLFEIIEYARLVPGMIFQQMGDQSA